MNACHHLDHDRRSRLPERVSVSPASGLHAATTRQWIALPPMPTTRTRRSTFSDSYCKENPRPSINPSSPTHPSIARAHTEVHRPPFPIKRSSLPDSAGDRLTRGRKLLAVSPPPTRSPTSTVPTGSKQLVHTRKHGHTTYTDSHAREPSRTQCVRIAVWMQLLRHC